MSLQNKRIDVRYMGSSAVSQPFIDWSGSLSRRASGYVTPSFSKFTYFFFFLCGKHHTRLGVLSAKRRHQCPEWTILSHSYRTPKLVYLRQLETH